MKADSARVTSPLGGPELAGLAIAAGLVDEIHLFLTPIVVGGGQPRALEHCATRPCGAAGGLSARALLRRWELESTSGASRLAPHLTNSLTYC